MLHLCSHTMGERTKSLLNPLLVLKAFKSHSHTLRQIVRGTEGDSECALCLYAGRSGVCQDDQWPEGSNGEWHSELQQLSDQVRIKTAEQCLSHLISVILVKLYSLYFSMLVNIIPQVNKNIFFSKFCVWNQICCAFDTFCSVQLNIFKWCRILYLSRSSHVFDWARVY